MKNTMKGIATLCATAGMLLSAASLTGCNTMQGAGKDVSAAGNAVQKSSCEHNDTTTKDCSSTPK